MKQNFRLLLENLNILDTVTKDFYYDIDIYGYELKVYYQEFRLSTTEKIEFNEFSLIDKTEIGDYGFIIEDEYSETSTIHKGQAGTTFIIDSISPISYSDEVNLNFLIKGNPQDIEIIAFGRKLYVEISASGCLKNISFWKDSLYISYVLFKSSNILSSFMHLFIGIEGMLREYTNNYKGSIHNIYKDYTNKELPNYLNAYRNIRNQVLHGNENIAHFLTEEDIGILIKSIDKLLHEKKSLSLKNSTTAIEKGLQLNKY